MKIYVQKIRDQKGMSIAELSKRSGLSVSAIYDIENYNHNPQIQSLCKIAKALGVPCETLYNCD